MRHVMTVTLVHDEATGRYVFTQRLRQEGGWYQSEMGFRCGTLEEATKVVLAQGLAMAEMETKQDRTDMPQGKLKAICDAIVAILIKEA